MLKLNNITKTYKLGDLETKALKGVSIEFRKSEFVSILGPSGCGKTTLLNIVGGLDRYTSGDLVIGGVSTKKFKDKDWDVYRNHSVGFVFQSYNLIPHQTVLENVELALTLSGVSKSERKRRATRVLKQVGLGDKLKNKPNQLSGGQMQRVAIARALVNDPEIILADEPTGALDTKSSVQIMEILKEVAKDRLVVMVTHNPELASKYSTRIINLLDGKLQGDSNPFDSTKQDEFAFATTQEENKVKKSKRKHAKKRMSFFTAMSLSFKNLLTKKARTILVTFAGSIGIIGIALVLAISSGFQTFINKQQEKTLSNYPITIEAKSIDFVSAFTGIFGKMTEDQSSATHDGNKIYSKDRMSNILGTIGSTAKPNNLKNFYEYIESHRDELKSYVSAIQYSYDLGLQFYPTGLTYVSENDNLQPSSTALYRIIMAYCVQYFEFNAKVTMTKTEDGYNVGYVEGQTVQKVVDQFLGEGAYNSLVENGSIPLPNAVIMHIVNGMLGSGGMMGFSLEQYKQSNPGTFFEMIDNDEIAKDAIELVAGTKPQNKNQIVLVVDKNNEIDDYVMFSLGLISENQVDEILHSVVSGAEKPTIAADYSAILGKEFKVLTTADYYVKHESTYVDLRVFNMPSIGDNINPLYDPQRYQQELDGAYERCSNVLKVVGVAKQTDNKNSSYVDTGLAYSKEFTNSLIQNFNTKVEAMNADGASLKTLSEGDPTKIEIYVSSFEAKDKVKAFVEAYNAQAGEGNEISYSDLAGTIMTTVSTIITAITYVLIAFVAVSLVVSSIMIAVITYISVIERTKEIGVLRSVGASKKDVSRVFTAESFIIGLSSGVAGIVVSLLLTIPINIVLKSYTNLAGLASLPLGGSFILIGISVVLTLIAGFFPSKMAAKKDPVVALREN